jgi:hypothetical protein
VLALTSIEETRAWLRGVLDRKRLFPATLATKAKLHPSTLTRFLNGHNVTHDLSRRTITAIEKATGILWGEDTVREPLSDAAIYQPGNDELSLPVCAAVKHLIANQPSLECWVLSSSVIELNGYLPGDILIVDQKASPVDGDAVAVRRRGNSGGLNVRIYLKPYLVAAAIDPTAWKPMLLDDHTEVTGVIVSMFRHRKEQNLR